MPVCEHSAEPSASSPDGKKKRRRRKPVSVPDLDNLPGDALLTRRQTSLALSFAIPTLKAWAKKGRGPQITRVEGLPRYRVGDVKAWIVSSNG